MLEVVILDKQEAWDELHTLYGPRSIQPGNEDVFRNILAYVHDQCRAAIVESDYIDPDYRSSYSAFYSQMFNPPDFACHRLHLFKVAPSVPDPGPDELHEFLTAVARDHAYLGFVVLRPTPTCRVGRTVLAPVMLAADQYVTCGSVHEASLLGVTLAVRGAPFHEQDGYVARCAEVVIRSCILHMERSHGLREYSTPTIHELLTTKSHDRHPLPSDGLSPGQMAEAFKTMGYNPVSFDSKTVDPWRPCELLYPYLESGVPVIVFGTWQTDTLHTELVVGHSSRYTGGLRSRKCPIRLPWHRNRQDLLPTTMGWVDGLLINDDSRGPYRFYPISDPEVQGIHQILVPLPPKIHLKPFHIEEYVSQLLNPLGKGVTYLSACASPGSPLKKFLDQQMDDLVLHTFFCRSNLLKMSMAHRPDPPVPEVAWFLRMVNMPRYVWVSEITTQQLWMTAKKRIIGQFVFDTTASSFSTALLLQHVPGFLHATQYRDPERDRRVTLDVDRAYSPFFISQNTAIESEYD